MSTLKRPLFADFELHTDGDSAFKNELIVLMVANILELKRATDLSLEAFQLIGFREVCHKITTTLNILADDELTGIVLDIKRNGDSGEKISLVHSLCSQVIASLQEELTIKVSEVYPVYLFQ